MSLTLADAVRALDVTKVEPDPIDGLFALSSRIAKQATPERVALKDLNLTAEPSPEAVAEQRLYKGYSHPIQVTQYPDGKLWVTRGEDRVVAAMRDGQQFILARVVQKEAEFGKAVATVDEAARIPAGDPRRGRIHPGEWTAEEARAMGAVARAKAAKKAESPEELDAAAQQARSHVERTVIQHRARQLRSTVAVPGRLSDEELARTSEELEQSKAALRAPQVRLYRKSREVEMRAEAIRRTLGYGAIEDELLRQAALKPAAKAAQREQARQEKREAPLRERARKLRDQYDDLYWKGDARTKAEDTRMVRLHRDVVMAEGKLRAQRRETYDAAERARDTLYQEARKLDRAKVEAQLARQNAATIKEVTTSLLDAAEKRYREGHQESIEGATSRLAAHQRAGAEAKRKAAEARRVQPRFEAQNLRALDESVRGKNLQPRAIFLEDSVFDDDLAYVSHGKPRRLRTVKVPQLDAGIAANNTPENLRRKYFGDYIVDHDGGGDAARQLALRTMSIAYEEGGSVSPANMVKALTGYDTSSYTWDAENAIKITAGDAKKLVAGWQKAGAFSTKSREEFAETSATQFRVIGDVRRDKEKTVLDALRGAGAKITDNELEIPDYKSWWKGGAGKRYTLELGGGKRIQYVPHGNVETDVTDWTHTFTIDPAKQVAKMKAAIDETYANTGGSINLKALPKDMLMIGQTNPMSPDVPRYMRPSIASPELLAAFKAGETTHTVTGTAGYSTTYAMRKVTPDALKQMGYVKVGDSWLPPSTAGYYQEALDALGEFASQKPFAIKATSAKRDDLPDLDTLMSKRLSSMKLTAGARSALRRKPIMAAITGAATRKSERRARVSKAKHDAPFSERGVMRFENMNSTEATKVMKKLGLAQGVVSSVPNNLIYEGDGRLGRVSPKLEDYATGRQSIGLPDGWGVVHGMTSRSDPIANLQKIIDTGGLKSIAERRRQGIANAVQGMSEVGDTGSGIDTGVPTTLGNKSYGNYIAFQMKPSILERRDVYFAPTDYGGGKDRWPKYTRYAQSIGQQSIFTPPSHQTRMRHLGNISAGTSNEAIFRNEIPWNDIDSVHVETSYYKQALSMVNKAKKQGKIPAHVKVIEVGGAKGPANFGVSIPQRAREIAAGVA